MSSTGRRHISIGDYHKAIVEILCAEKLEGADGLYFCVAQVAAGLTTAKHAVVALPDPPNVFRIAGCEGFPTTELRSFGAGHPLARGIIAKAFADRDPVALPDVKDRGPYLPYEYFAFDMQVQSELAVPILDASRKWVEAVINVESADLDHFVDPEYIALLQQLGCLMLVSRQHIHRVLKLSREREAAFRVLRKIPDEVMVIDTQLRPVWANDEKRNAEGLRRLDCFLPEARVSESDLTELLTGRVWPEPKTTETCYSNIEGREEPCRLCVCRRAMESRQPLLGVVYKPNLPFAVELSAVPLFSEEDCENGSAVLGCVETARRVTMREKVLEIAPRLWRVATVADALEETAKALVEQVGFSRVRLYRVEQCDGAMTLVPITLAGNHPGIDKDTFRGRQARFIPTRFHEVMAGADKAALFTLHSGSHEIDKEEESFGYYRVTASQHLVAEAFDPSGELRLAHLGELVTVPLIAETRGIARWLMCIDWHGSQTPFTNDDLQALTIYSRMASAGIERVHQGEWVSKLAVLGEVAALLAHQLTRTTDIQISKASPHLRNLLTSAADYLHDAPAAPSWQFLASAFSSQLERDAAVPLEGATAESAEELWRAMHSAGVEVPRRVIVQLARVMPRSAEVVRSWAHVLQGLPGAPWQLLEDIVTLVVALKTQEVSAKNLGIFTEAVQGTFPVTWWEVCTF